MYSRALPFVPSTHDPSITSVLDPLAGWTRTEMPNRQAILARPPLVPPPAKPIPTASVGGPQLSLVAGKYKRDTIRRRRAGTRASESSEEGSKKRLDEKQTIEGFHRMLQLALGAASQEGFIDGEMLESAKHDMVVCGACDIFFYSVGIRVLM